MKSLVSVLALALVACHQASPDTASPDAGSPDAVHFDANHGDGPPVIVYAYYERDPGHDSSVKPGAIVLFYDADGELVDRAVTGDDGKATGLVRAGGSVTVVPPPGSSDLYTWVDVAPGDHLFNAEDPGPPGPPQGSTLTVTLPRDADATSYRTSFVGGGTSQEHPPATGSIETSGFVRSSSEGVTDLVAEARHADGHKRFFVAHGVKVDGGPIDLGDHAWADPTVQTFTFTAVPDKIEYVNPSYLALTGTDWVWSGDLADHVITHPAATFAASFETPGAIGDGSALQTYFMRDRDGGSPDSWFLTINHPGPTIDLASMMPPTATVAPPDHGRFSWTVDGDPARALGLALQMYTSTATWTVLLPPDRRAFTLPSLPSDVPAPPAFPQARAQFLGGVDPAGYAGVRTQAAMSPYQWAQRWPSSPGAYRMGRAWR